MNFKCALSSFTELYCHTILLFVINRTCFARNCCCCFWYHCSIFCFLDLSFVYVTHIHIYTFEKGKSFLLFVSLWIVFKRITCALFNRFIAYQKQKCSTSKSSRVPVNFNEVRSIGKTRTFPTILFFSLNLSLLLLFNRHPSIFVVDFDEQMQTFIMNVELSSSFQ